MKPIAILSLQLAEVSDSAKFVQRAKKIRNWSRSIAEIEQIDPELKHLIEEIRTNSDQDYQVISNSLLVSAWGSFEDFIRTLLPYLTKKINALQIPCTKIRAELLTQNIYLTSDALRTSAGGSKLYNFSQRDLAKNLVETYSDGGCTTLNCDAFGMTSGKFTLEDLSKYLKRLDYTIKWINIGDSTDIQKLLASKNKTAAGNKSKELIQNIISERNKIAHQGGNTIVLKNDITFVADFLNLFAQQLNKLLEEHIHELKRT